MKTFKTWGDLSNHYSLVLFNNCVKLNDGAILNEWMENHKCELEDGQEYCECEVYQWYAIAISEFDQEYLNKKYNLDIFFSDTLGIYILPVYHYGTSWDYVNLNANE